MYARRSGTSATIHIALQSQLYDVLDICECYGEHVEFGHFLVYRYQFDVDYYCGGMFEECVDELLTHLWGEVIFL